MVRAAVLVAILAIFTAAAGRPVTTASAAAQPETAPARSDSRPDYAWRREAGGRCLYANGRSIATIPLYPEAAGLSATDEIETLADGVFAWTRRFTLAAEADAQPVRLTLDLAAAWPAQYWIIPAVSYGGNGWGSGGEPKGWQKDGVPWSFAYHRTAVPGATYSEGLNWSIALFGRMPAPACGFACSIVVGEQETIHRLIFPEEEQPVAYTGRDEFGPGVAERLVLQPGETFAASAYIVAAQVTRPRIGWRRFLDVAWELNDAPRPMPFTPETLREIGVAFTRAQLWAEEPPFRGFSIGLLWDGQKWYQRPARKYEIGWAGQNASLACALLHDYLLNKRRESLDKGLATLDTWVQHGRLPSGLVQTIIDPITGAEWGDFHDACNLGNAAADFFEGHDLAQRCGVSRPEYRELALRICRFLLADQQPDGRYGRAWTAGGRCLDRDGTIGAYIIPAMIAAHRATGEEQFLRSAERAYRFYSDGLLTSGFTTAGALDTDCIDKESAYPLIDSGLALYDCTGRRAYLDAVEAASYYTATWQYHFSVPIPSGGMLAEMGYDSFGGTAVSTQHHHVDPYAIRCVPAWLRLAQLTDKPIWEKRARAAWRNGMLGVSDGSLRLRGATVPAGGQCEGYYQTRWADRGNASLWLVAWPSAFRLEVLRRLPDWDPLR